MIAAIVKQNNSYNNIICLLYIINYYVYYGFIIITIMEVDEKSNIILWKNLFLLINNLLWSHKFFFLNNSKCTFSKCTRTTRLPSRGVEQQLCTCEDVVFTVVVWNVSSTFPLWILRYIRKWHRVLRTYRRRRETGTREIFRHRYTLITEFVSPFMNLDTCAP